MFKIYQIHEMGGAYEESFDNVIGSYLRKKRAEEVLNNLRGDEDKRRARALKCQDCPVHDRGCTNRLIIGEYCEDFDDAYAQDDDGEYLFCKNEYCSYPAYDNRCYRIDEVEVEEE